MTDGRPYSHRRSQYEEDIVFNEVPESHHIVMRTVSLKGAGGLFACARQGLRGLKIIARMSAVQVFRVEVVVTAVLINLSCCLLVFVVKQFLTRMRGTKITALNIRRITS